MSDKLKLWYDKKQKDLIGTLPDGEVGHWDLYLLFNVFLGNKVLDENNLLSELKDRGYDITTIKFEISKNGNTETQIINTKELTLDEWDKSVVNKINRLEKSLVLEDKVKREIKQKLKQSNSNWDKLKEWLMEQFDYWSRHQFGTTMFSDDYFMCGGKLGFISQLQDKIKELEKDFEDGV